MSRTLHIPMSGAEIDPGIAAFLLVAIDTSQNWYSLFDTGRFLMVPERKPQRHKEHKDFYFSFLDAHGAQRVSDLCVFVVNALQVWI